MLAAIGGPDAEGERAIEYAAYLLGEIRRRKSEEQKPLRAPVARLLLRVPDGDRVLVDVIRGDVCASGFVQRLDVEPASERGVIVELEAPEAAGESRA
jgi:hypothetical protein